MKTKLILSALFTFAFCLLPSTAQVPQGFNYQAIARDGSGNILPNQVLPVKIDIQTTLGTLIYEELFASVTSNQFGLISLVVGTGTQTGGSATSFSAIDWKAQTLYLKTTIQYPGTTWTVMGTSQIWAVPYSLVAKNVEGPLTKLGIEGTTSDMDEALFEVKNKAGNTVFAVYNEGVRAYVGNGDAKGVRGGFAVGGYDATKGTTIYDLLVLNTDSTRIYVDSKPNLKGKKGGFSVGGYDMTKGGTSVQNYLDVTPATTKIFTADTVKGFAVGNVSTGTAESYLKLTPSNYFIGHQAGDNITTGKYNSVIGYQSGYTTSTGNSNSFFGYKSGYLNSSGTNNVFIGNNAGYSNTTGTNNVFIGPMAGNKNTTGSSNVFIGIQAGRENIDAGWGVNIGIRAGLLHRSGDETVCIGYEAGSGYDGTLGAENRTVTGQSNTLIGCEAGKTNLTGSDNTIVGNESGIQFRGGSRNTYLGAKIQRAPIYSTEPDDNVYIGYDVAYNNMEGDQNVMIGSGAGYSSSGSNNVFIGYNVGVNETTSNKLYIDKSNTSSPLIWGDFSSKLLNFNGYVGIGTNAPSERLDVRGTIRNTVNTSYDVWIQGGAATSGTSRNLALLGEISTDKLYLNYGGEYTGGTIIGGFVGLGTTSPAYKLDVVGRSRFQTGSGSAGFWLMNTANTADRSFIGMYDDNYAGIYGIGSGWGLVMNLNNGFVGIGTATPSYKFQVNNSLADYIAYINNTLGVNTSRGLKITSGSNTVSGSIFIGFHRPDDVSIGLITQSGASTINYGTTSDVRVKENIKDTRYSINDLLKIKVHDFNFIYDPNKQLFTGFIAQELIDIFPNAVSKPENESDLWTLDYGKITPLLVKAVQDQQQQIESQKQENQQLKSELQALREEVEQIKVVQAKGGSN